MAKLRISNSKSVTAKYDVHKKLPPKGIGPEGTMGGKVNTPKFEEAAKSIPSKRET